MTHCKGQTAQKLTCRLWDLFRCQKLTVIVVVVAVAVAAAIVVVVVVCTSSLEVSK